MRFIHRLLLLRYGIPQDFVLNSGPMPDDILASKPVAADLRQMVSTLKAEAYDTQQRHWDYARLCAASAECHTFLSAARRALNRCGSK